MHPMLNIAVRAARAAGKEVVRAFEQPDKTEVQSKGSNGITTNINVSAEEVMIDVIKKSYPKHTIIGEESGLITGEEADVQWVISSIDGTTNFIKAIPHFSVTIAIKVKGKIDQAVVYDPIRGELFSASRGKGAQLNGTRLRVSQPKELASTVLATNFPVKHKQHTTPYMAMLQSLFTKTSAIRQTGSSSLDLAYVAAGRVDGFFEIGLKPWNYAAGELLIVEAGGIVADFTGNNNQEKSGNVVAASTKVLREVLKDIRPNLGEALSK